MVGDNPPAHMSAEELVQQGFHVEDQSDEKKPYLASDTQKSLDEQWDNVVYVDDDNHVYEYDPQSQDYVYDGQRGANGEGEQSEPQNSEPQKSEPQMNDSPSQKVRIPVSLFNTHK